MISVILPAYNAEATVREAVQSVLDQKCDVPIELIALDDGSTDGTLAVLHSIDDPRIQIHSHSNCGPSATRNRGVALSTGQWIAWADADDVWVSTKLDSQLTALGRSPECAVAYGWVDYRDEDGKFLCPDQRATFEGDVYGEVLLRNFICSGSNTMVHREAFEAVGGFDESLRACEDWDLHARLAAKYAFACVPEVVTGYRISRGSLTSQFRLMEAAHLRASERLFAAAPEHLRSQRARCDARFFAYLAVRSAQTGGTWDRRRAALRYTWLSIRKSPGLAISLHARALGRGVRALLGRRVQP